MLDVYRIQEVIIADPDFPQERAVELVDTCHQRGVTVRIAPSTMEILVQRAEFVPGASVPLFELRPPVFDGIDYFVKRTFDIVVSALLLLAPVAAAGARSRWLVRFSSRGPIIYRSFRPGIGGEPFACLKFRTMFTDADERQEELESLNEASGALFKIRQDPRDDARRAACCAATRSTSCRSWSTCCAARCRSSARGRCRSATSTSSRTGTRSATSCCPGLTGLWQISGRSELDFDDLVRLDFLYLERWSVGLDLAILLKTIPAVSRAAGAF